MLETQSPHSLHPHFYQVPCIDSNLAIAVLFALFVSYRVLLPLQQVSAAHLWERNNKPRTSAAILGDGACSFQPYMATHQESEALGPVCFPVTPVAVTAGWVKTWGWLRTACTVPVPYHPRAGKAGLVGSSISSAAGCHHLLQTASEGLSHTGWLGSGKISDQYLTKLECFSWSA